MTDDAIRQQRAEWRRYREYIDMNEPAIGDTFATGGLAAHAAPLDLRVVVLPIEPADANRVTLDGDTAAWLEQPRPGADGGEPIQWGHSTTATSSALARVSWHNDDQVWDRYLAIHRHGGLEAGLSRIAWTSNREVRVFALRHIVAALWMVADAQVDAGHRWSIEGPWEVSLALRDTAEAVLGDFAEGWAPFDDFRRNTSRCREPHVLHRWIVADIDPPALADDAGARLENSFGTTAHRHRAQRGEHEGRFDPRLRW